MSNLKTFNSRKYSDRSAYSLLELSMILIIIGLLVAGITSANSLIKSAEMRSLMNEAREHNMAVNTFYVQFDELPGDFETALDGGGATTTTQAGDGNGAIEYVNSNGVTDIKEGVSAWQQLSAVGIIDNDLTFTDFTDFTVASTGYASSSVCSIELPHSKTKNGCWVFDHRNSQNVVIITAALAQATVTSHILGTADRIADEQFTGILTPSDAFSIDVKMDDGVGTTGDIRDPYNTASTVVVATCATSAGIYKTTTKTKICTLSFAVGILG